MYKLIVNLITQSKQATFTQLAQLTTQASLASFAADLLEVDEPLWGSFWQGDVIAPGYRLPAVELTLLRAIRLDQTWPKDTTVAEFLADLRQVILDPQAGVWILMVAGQPWMIFATPLNIEPSTLNLQPLATVVWYCATTEQLHAGYRTAIATLNFSGAVEQRPLGFTTGATPPASERSASHPESVHQPGWLEQILERDDTSGGRQSAVGGQSLAARLDAEILRVRRQEG